MPQAVDRASLDRLIALGRMRGELRPEDLRAVLPVEAMRVEDVALVILELEEAGVSVEPDAFGPARAVPAAMVLPMPARAPASAAPARAAAEATEPSVTTRGSAARADPAPRTEPQGEAARVHRIVALAGLATLLVLGAILLRL